jgi:hypothetical protein
MLSKTDLASGVARIIRDHTANQNRQPKLITPSTDRLQVVLLALHFYWRSGDSVTALAIVRTTHCFPGWTKTVALQLVAIPRSWEPGS